MTKAAKNALQALSDCGQSVWLDFISRELIASGELKRLVTQVGVRGVTSNPDIFQKAIAGSSLYDKAIERLARTGHSTLEIYETLAVEDIRKAADILRPVWQKTRGGDGYISLEVSPHLAYDAVATIDEAERLWATVGRPNLMIKIPATPAGLVAIEELIARGINVNVTLLFSIAVYKKVMEAYTAGLQRRAKRNLPLDCVRSVASFFVSRLDTLVDSLLASRITNLPEIAATTASRVFGKTAVACAKLSYLEYEQFFSSARFKKLAARGAQTQRPLWASTSTKNPLYDPLAYVTPLVGRDTVNTLPLATLEALLAGTLPTAETIHEGVAEARAVIETLSSLSIDIESVATQLLEDGVARFIRSFDALLSAIAEKRLHALGLARLQSESPQDLSASVPAVQRAVSELRYLPRLWKKDASLWTENEDVAQKIVNRLGWLESPFKMLSAGRQIQRFAADVAKAGFTHVVLLGMGGSSLCPEVCSKTFGSRTGYPKLIVLDNTSPDAVRAVEKSIDLKKTLFIPASKSGTTIETNSFYKYFRLKLASLGIKNIGEHFVAITDPGTPLAELGRQERFRAVFENPADIGGRFSALSFFGLVPMALLGLDIAQLLARAIDFALDRGTVINSTSDSAVRLGVFLAECAKVGRDKLTFVISDVFASFGDWVEQLVAESTGKCGIGILPVVGERVIPAISCGPDRAFVSMRLAKEKEDPRLSAIEKRGAPVVRIVLPDLVDLGVEFFRWEVATAIAGALLRINPFDEPNVTESKQNTARLLEAFTEQGKLPVPPTQIESRGLRLTFSKAAMQIVGSKISRPKDALRALLLSAEPPDYVALLVYAQSQKRLDAKLAALRSAIQKATGCATTLGYGPRYLHSTGQLHKGGPNTGVFLMIVADPAKDVEIPGEAYSFATLARAQALGDFEALAEHGRRAILVQVGEDAAAAVTELLALAGLDD
jgi:transaldolase/glucose-6-phosphate isomerase